MKALRPPWPEAVMLILAGALLLGGVSSVPFHPDETSWLFQSRDLERLASAPLSLAWRPASDPTPELTYRLLNAPLAKYALAAGRLAAGFPASSVSVDWDWTQGWEENAAAGAVVPGGLLAAARVASTVLLVAAIAAIYVAGRGLEGRTTGLMAGLLLATNSLALLHGRRAMAEGALILGVSVAVIGVIHADRRPWIAGVAAGLAAAAKTSAAIWIPVGLLATVWPTGTARRSAPAVARRLATFAAASVITVLVLHPVLWASPLGAVRAMWDARQSLVAAQVEMTGILMPGVVLAGVGDRLLSMLAHLFFAPPQFAEAANYLAHTAAAEAAYLASPGSVLLRGFVGGGLVLGLTLLGLAARQVGGAAARRHGLVAAATLAQAAALVVFVPLGFQRYWIPLVPLVCLWAGRGIAGIVAAATQIRRPLSRAADPGAGGGATPSGSRKGGGDGSGGGGG